MMEYDPNKWELYWGDKLITPFYSVEHEIVAPWWRITEEDDATATFSVRDKNGIPARFVLYKDSISYSKLINTDPNGINILEFSGISQNEENTSS